MPLISLITPIFNSEKYISSALNSIISQHYVKWEIIVVDDGSTDNSEKIIQDYVQTDSRIKYFKRHRLPKGAPTCRNIGLEKAKGEYVIFFDSDDILAPFCLEQRLTKMQQNTKDDFAVFQQYSFTDSLENLSISSQLHKKNILYCVIATDNIWQTMGAIWKRSFLLKIGGFDEGFPRFQDDDLHLKALMQKDVNYALYNKLPPDCYYRDIDRSHQNQYCVDGVNSLIMYLKKVSGTYEPNIEKRNLLVWSINAAVTKAVLYFMLSKENNLTEIRELIAGLYKKGFLRKNDLSFYSGLMDDYSGFKSDNEDYIKSINSILSQRFRKYASYIQISPFKQKIILYSGYPRRGIKKILCLFNQS